MSARWTMGRGLSSSLSPSHPPLCAFSSPQVPYDTKWPLQRREFSCGNYRNNLSLWLVFTWVDNSTLGLPSSSFSTATQAISFAVCFVNMFPVTMLNNQWNPSQSFLTFFLILPSSVDQASTSHKHHVSLS